MRREPPGVRRVKSGARGTTLVRRPAVRRAPPGTPQPANRKRAVEAAPVRPGCLWPSSESRVSWCSRCGVRARGQPRREVCHQRRNPGREAGSQNLIDPSGLQTRPLRGRGRATKRLNEGVGGVQAIRQRCGIEVDSGWSKSGRGKLRRRHGSRRTTSRGSRERSAGQGRVRTIGGSAMSWHVRDEPTGVGRADSCGGRRREREAPACDGAENQQTTRETASQQATRGSGRTERRAPVPP